ncbi:unnamed protein product, partial [Allacma fusca]
NMPLEETNMNAGTLCNDPINVLGLTSGIITVKNVDFNFKAYVIQNLASDMLLGLDFLIKQKANINFVEGCLEFGIDDKRIKIPLDKKWIDEITDHETVKNEKNFLVVTKDCIIPPKTSIIANKKIETSVGVP